MEARERLIVALDVENEEKCSRLVDELAPVVDVFKVGIAPFTEYGHKILRKLEGLNKKVFLDLKFHDIPNTVKNAARVAAGMNVFMMNFHCVGGAKMLEAARSGAEEGAAKSGKKRPLLLGVTVLTSMKEEDLAEIGMKGSVPDKVAEFARLAKASGMDGVVASAQETKLIKEKTGGGFIVVTPGIRPAWADEGDQKRIVTPKDAVLSGSDYIVVGRPIIEAKSPREAARKIIEEMG